MALAVTDPVRARGKGLRRGRERHQTIARTEARGAIVRVRLTEAEQVALAEVARDMGLSLSSFSRRVLLDRPLPPRRPLRAIPEINQRTCVELARIGASIDQLAGHANGGIFPERKSIIDALELLARAIAAVKTELIGAGEVSKATGEWR